MPIQHHLDMSTLMSCASGAQPESLAGVIVAHLSVCPACRRELSDLSRIGTALFDALPPVAMNAAARDPGVQPARPAAKVGAPRRPATAFTPDELAAMPWTEVEPGIRYAPMPLSAHVRGDLGLVSLAPGVRLPAGVRDASDLTFVVAGSYVGNAAVYRPGDVADAGDATRSDVVADAETGCICLIASEAQDLYRSRVAG